MKKKESFVTRTPVLLVDTSDTAIGDVSVSIAIAPLGVGPGFIWRFRSPISSKLKEAVVLG